MNDEPIKSENQKESDYDTRDPEVPIALHHPPSDSNEIYPKKKAHSGKSYLGPSLHWLWSKARWLGRNIILNHGLWMVLSTIVIAGATCFYAYYATETLKAINDQLPQLQKSADAAEKAATTAASELDASRDSQSAQLVVEKFDAKLVPPRPIVIDIGHHRAVLLKSPRKELEIQVALTIKNAGPTVAKEIFIMKNGGSFDTRTEPVQYPPWKWDTPLPLSSGRSLAPGGTFVYQPELPLSQSEGVSTGGRMVYFTIGISYRDIFGRPHIVTECDYYSPITPPHWRGCFWTPAPKKH